MFCPECEAEYRPGFTRCHDCDVDLVERLEKSESATEHQDPDYVLVKTVQGLLEEGQIRSFLEANGISTQVRGEAVRTTHSLTIDGLGAVSILVPRSQADAARELLDEADRGQLALDETPDDPE